MEEGKISNIISRFRFLYLFYLMVTLLFIYKIIYIQFISKERITSDDLYRTTNIEAIRGSILAHDGRPLATSIPYYEIRMDCVSPSDEDFKNNLKELSSSLSGIFKNKSASAYEKEISQARKDKKRYLKIGDRDLTYSEMKEVSGYPLFRMGKFKGGIIIEEKYKRIKPYGSLANRTIGFINSEDEGVGIERSFNHLLKGKNGVKTIQRQVGGTWTTVLSEKSIQAVNGMDIHTTLDIDIQEAVEVALREQLAKEEVLEGGTAIVMEVKTGAIRAITNMKKTGSGTYDETYNYAIAEATNPGSTFKVATLISLIEDGAVKLEDKIDAGNGRWMYAGTPFTDVTPGGYGEITVQEAFEKSSNVAFAKLVVNEYEKRENDFVKRLQSLKINEKMGLEIMGEGNSYIQTPNDKYWSKVSLPMLSIGYEVLLTPMHTLTFYNAIANNGKMMKPYFIESFSRNDQIIEQRRPQQITGSICSKKTLAEVKKALRGVVENGTARSYNDPRYSISGKTGTAQIAFDGRYKDSEGNRKHQASFAGFFPSEDPKYTIIVVLYSGKTRSNFYGGSWATPVFKKIADNIYSSSRDWEHPLSGRDSIPKETPDIANGLARATKKVAGLLPVNSIGNIPERGWISINGGGSGYDIQNMTISENEVPSVINMGLKDALYVLENEGYKVEFKGSGRVTEQIPSPGTINESKGVIRLILNN